MAAMRIPALRLCITKSYLAFLFILPAFALLVLTPNAGWSDGPALARLSFWVPPESRAAFTAAYEENVEHLLARQGLRPSLKQGRATPDSVFSRLFELRAPAGLIRAREALTQDPAWSNAVSELAKAFGGDPPRRESIRYSLSIYSATATRGHSIEVTEKGHWGTDKQDGMPKGIILSMLQDQKGYIWFGHYGGGVSRYDGRSFTSFTTENGLGSNDVIMLLEDRDGYIWIVTRGGGVSRYDGQAFITFNAEDGLGHDEVHSIVQDQDGELWFGHAAGASRFDGQTFLPVEGLPLTSVQPILQDRDGHIWFCSWRDGVSRYDGRRFTTFTAEDGVVDNMVLSIIQDRVGHIWFGSLVDGVSRYDGHTFTTFTSEHGLTSNNINAIVQDREGTVWFGTNDGVSRYDGRSFTPFDTGDGLVSNQVTAMLEDREGYLWFGHTDGVSRYDGQTFTTFTSQDRLTSNTIAEIAQDREGNLWFDSWGGGVGCYDGESWTALTTAEGLADDNVQAIYQDQAGDIWLGTRGGGANRYDGRTLTTFAAEDGLPDNNVLAIGQDLAGRMWFGTRTGASRYDGRAFTTFTAQDGLGSQIVKQILRDRAGNMWFATELRGAVRYDGETWASYGKEQGVADNHVLSMAEDRDGALWFGHAGGGVTRFDPKAEADARCTIFSAKEGLVGYPVRDIVVDAAGHLWFATDTGVSRYDGRVFQTLTAADGLAASAVHSVAQDRAGNMWFGGIESLTRFRPPPAWPPLVSVHGVTADRRYKSAAELEIPSTANLVSFEFGAMSFKTRPGATIYRYRLKGLEEDWRRTYDEQVEYEDLPIGNYVFEVAAVDRDLVYSEPATVHLAIDPPYNQIALWCGLGLSIIGMLIASSYGVKRRRERNRLQLERDQAREDLVRELAQELQTARDLQQGLMPKEAPSVEGLEIAARCIPATQVGGDFFQYFHQADGLSVSTADVTGHAMEAAIPVVMFEGVLDTHLRLGTRRLEDLFSRLNDVMAERLTGRTHVCFSMAQIDINTRAVRFANAGCPYPLHFHAATGDVTELEADAYPLGVQAGTSYHAIETQLLPGDRLVFCSDGIMEARNARGDMFGFDKTAETLRQGCEEGLGSEALLERMLHEVRRFSSDHPQEDDQTIVVVGVAS